MPPRSYVSPARSAAAAETRERVIEAAARTLREGESMARFSLDTVAKAAGVTRLTVYNQFGSRRGLLEAVFDEIARHGGLHQLADAMAMADPRAALDRMVEIFCAFWSRDSAVARLHDAMATDPEFAEAVRERNERRPPRRHRIGRPHRGQGRIAAGPQRCRRPDLRADKLSDLRLAQRRAVER